MTAAEAAAITVPFDGVLSDGGAALNAVLHDHGVAIVSGCVPPEELRRLEGLFSDDLRDLVDVEAANASASPSVRTAAERVAASGAHAWPRGTHLGSRKAAFAWRHALPHGRFAWSARAHPRVRQVFRHVYGDELAGDASRHHSAADTTAKAVDTDSAGAGSAGSSAGASATGARAGSDMVVSTDVLFFTPKSAATREAASCRLWPHADQNIHDPDVGHHRIFQGVLYVWPSDGSDGTTNPSTTVVWPRSHHEGGPYGTLMADANIASVGKAGGNYCQISAMTPSPERTALMAGWCDGARRVPVPAGGLLLWSSRTMHQGWAGGPRLAAPTCWEPAARRPDQALLRKLRLTALGLPSTHWACKGEQHSLSLDDDVQAPVEAVAPAAGAGASGEEGDPDDATLPLHGRLSAARQPGNALATGAEEDSFRETFWYDYAPESSARPVLAAAVTAEVSDDL